ncbi:MAG TPA: hypothetical protein VK468_01775 [Pyrinomonadaceae bacterium]|nr:hypothetical protein [Pyrinomonadaceae bacterium]
MNEQIETMEKLTENNAVKENYATSAPPDPEAHGSPLITPQGGCGTRGGSEGTESNRLGNGAASYVYAIGKVEARFPNLAAEKEFAQATSRADEKKGTNQQTFHAVLSQPGNRYLARQLCWVLSIQGLETYLLVPREPNDVDLLLEAIRSEPGPGEIDVVVGMRGPIAPPTMCNGLMVPMIIFDQIYSFDQTKLIDAIPPPDKTTRTQFRPAAEEMFNRIMHMADNAGATDEHRALNYLAMRYPAIYTKTAEENAREFSLTGVEVLPSLLSGTRKIVDVVFGYTNRVSDFKEKFFVRVDVTEEFPFLVTKMSPYYDR